jgi:hypothetical protein
MKKFISIVIASVITLSAVLNFNISGVRAASGVEYFKSVSFEVLPDDSRITEGYINSTNTSFRINAIPTADFLTYKISLYLDDAPIPVDERLFDNGPDYTFSSGTSTVAELEALLGNGSHEWRLEAQDDKDAEGYIVAQGEFVSDFVLPTGKFFAEQIIPGDAPSKVGDTIAVGLAELSETSDICSVSGTIYGRDLTFIRKSKSFYADYIIQEGDPDRSINLQLTDASFIDSAGNGVALPGVNIPIDFSIDANSPIISLISPQNKTYASNNVSVAYEHSGATELLITLDGQQVNITSGGELADLTEGLHDLSVQAIDEAGNKSTSMVQFVTDTIAPQVTLSSQNLTLTQGDSFKIEGVGESCATVTLFEGDVLLASGSCDQLGEFNLQLDTPGWAIGQHDLVLTVIDGVGNSSKIAVLVTIKKKVAIARSVRVATSSRSVSVPQVIEPANNSEVVRAGRIIASNDSRPDKSVNWTAWLILAGLIALAGAIATTSYYGFAWLTLNRKTEVSPIAVEEDISKKADEEFAQINHEDKPSSEKIDPPEEPKNYTRW